MYLLSHYQYFDSKTELTPAWKRKCHRMGFSSRDEMEVSVPTRRRIPSLHYTKFAERFKRRAADGTTDLFMHSVRYNIHQLTGHLRRSLFCKRLFYVQGPVAKSKLRRMKHALDSFRGIVAESARVELDYLRRMTF